MPCPQAAALHTAGLSPVADSDSLDWKELSAPEITQRVLSPEALPDIIDSLMQEGYTFVTVNDLILTGDYTIDHTGRQCPAG